MEDIGSKASAIDSNGVTTELSADGVTLDSNLSTNSGAAVSDVVTAGLNIGFDDGNMSVGPDAVLNSAISAGLNTDSQAVDSSKTDSTAVDLGAVDSSEDTGLHSEKFDQNSKIIDSSIVDTKIQGFESENIDRPTKIDSKTSDEALLSKDLAIPVTGIKSESNSTKKNGFEPKVDTNFELIGVNGDSVDKYNELIDSNEIIGIKIEESAGSKINGTKDNENNIPKSDKTSNSEINKSFSNSDSAISDVSDVSINTIPPTTLTFNKISNSLVSPNTSSNDLNNTTFKESPLTDIPNSPEKLSKFSIISNSDESSELSSLDSQNSEAETDRMNFLDENNDDINSDLRRLSQLTRLARLKEVDSPLDDDSDNDLTNLPLDIHSDDVKMDDSDIEENEGVKDEGNYQGDDSDHLGKHSLDDEAEESLLKRMKFAEGIKEEDTSLDLDIKSEDDPIEAEISQEEKNSSEILDISVNDKDLEDLKIEMNDSPRGNKISTPRIDEDEEDDEIEDDEEEMKDEIEDEVKEGEEKETNIQQSEEKENPKVEVEDEAEAEAEAEADVSESGESKTGSSIEEDLKVDKEEEIVAKKDEVGNNSEVEDEGEVEEEEEDEEEEEEVEEEAEEEEEEDVDLNEQRKLAIVELNLIEESFAFLRDRLYQDKLKLLEHEVELCNEGKHYELSQINSRIKQYYQDNLKLADNNLAYKLKCIDIETNASRLSIHQNYMRRIIDTKKNLVGETTSLWYKINKERNMIDQMVTDYNFLAIPNIPNFTMAGPIDDGEGNLHSSLTKKAIKQNTIIELVQQRNNVNQQLGILNGLAQFHGFPSAVNNSEGSGLSVVEDLLLRKATKDEINDDLSAMGIPI